MTREVLLEDARALRRRADELMQSDEYRGHETHVNEDVAELFEQIAVLEWAAAAPEADPSDEIAREALAEAEALLAADDYARDAAAQARVGQIYEGVYGTDAVGPGRVASAVGPNTFLNPVAAAAEAEEI